MYHLAGLVFHWTTRLRQNVWAGIRIGVAVLVYGSSVGSYMQFVLRVQHAVAHALGVVRITWALWKETKGQSRDDIRRVHRGEALPTFHPHLFRLASAIVLLMAKHFYQRPWDYKDREGKRNQWWQKRSCSLFCHSKNFLKKSFCLWFWEAHAWEYSPASSLDPNRTVPFMPPNEHHD